MPTVRAPPARPSAGTHITGVDDITYSSTGEPFSTIGESRANRTRAPNPPLTRPCPCAVLPHCESTREKSLQSDDVSLGTRPPHTNLLDTHAPNAPLTTTLLACAAYEFAKKVRLK